MAAEGGFGCCRLTSAGILDGLEAFGGALAYEYMSSFLIFVQHSISVGVSGMDISSFSNVVASNAYGASLKTQMLNWRLLAHATLRSNAISNYVQFFLGHIFSP